MTLQSVSKGKLHVFSAPHIFGQHPTKKGELHGLHGLHVAHLGPLQQLGWLHLRNLRFLWFDRGETQLECLVRWFTAHEAKA